MDYLIFLTKVVGKNLICNPTIVTFLLIDVNADHGCSTPCTAINELAKAYKGQKVDAFEYLEKITKTCKRRQNNW